MAILKYVVNDKELGADGPIDYLDLDEDFACWLATKYVDHIYFYEELDESTLLPDEHNIMYFSTISHRFGNLIADRGRNSEETACRLSENHSHMIYFYDEIPDGFESTEHSIVVDLEKEQKLPHTSHFYEGASEGFETLRLEPKLFYYESLPASEGVHVSANSVDNLVNVDLRAEHPESPIYFLEFIPDDFKPMEEPTTLDTWSTDEDWPSEIHDTIESPYVIHKMLDVNFNEYMSGPGHSAVTKCGAVVQPAFVGKRLMNSYEKCTDGCFDPEPSYYLVGV